MKKKFFVILLACAVALLGAGGAAFAGTSDSYVVPENGVSGGKINSAYFFTDGDVTAQDTTMIFSGTSDVIAKTKINNLGAYGVKNLFSASVDLTFERLAVGGSFSAVFGMTGLLEGRASAKTVELRFFRDADGVWFTVEEFYSDDIPATRLEREQITALQSPGATATLEFSMTATDPDSEEKPTLTVALNGRGMLDGEQILRTDGAGFFGLYSEGENLVGADNLSVIAYNYDVIADSPDYTETFDKGYNANMFYSSSTASPLLPSKLSVEDGQLFFCNTASAYFSTRYRYSNFELTFDLTDLRREPVYDDYGNLTGLVSGWFGIAFGVGDVAQTADETVRLENWLEFRPMFPEYENAAMTPTGARFGLYENFRADTEPMKINIWDKTVVNDRTVGIKFTVTDGVVALYFRMGEDADWGEPQFTRNIGHTPSGYVRLFSWGDTGIAAAGIKYNNSAHFKIDNFSIKNTDFGIPTDIAKPEYKPNDIGTTPDFDYDTETDDGDLVFNRVNGGAGGGCSSQEGVAALLTVGIAAALALGRRF